MPPSSGAVHSPNGGDYDPSSTAWVLVCTFFVIMMQLGFAMLEVGSVRQAHRMTVLAKNVLDSCVACFALWGSSQCYHLSITHDKNGRERHHLLLFHWAFCTTSTTICSGSMAERTHMVAYLMHVALMAGVIYPTIADSAWGSAGPLRQFFHDGALGVGDVHIYHDFAGSGVVHLAGASTALVGTWLLGRRILQPTSDSYEKVEEFDAETLRALQEEEAEAQNFLKPPGGWPRRFDDSRRDEKEFVQMPYLQVMGMFTLWIGWYGFNTGSALVVDRPSVLAGGTVAWHTTLAAGSGGFGAFMHCCTFRKYLDVSFLCNGVLAGLVSITAGCDICTEGAAVAIGLTAGLLVYPLSSALLRAIRLDDPVDAIAVHWACGLLGVLAAGICHPECDALRVDGALLKSQETFCSSEHHWGKQLAAQALGALAIIAWSMSISLTLWSLFLVCEKARAFEAEHLAEAERLLCAMELTKAPEVRRDDPRWEKVASASPLARRALRRHGWRRSVGFVPGTPTAPWELQHELRQARNDEADSALEDGCGLLRGAARLLSCSWLVREMLFLRLRIPPAAELSGLGAAELQSGQAFPALRSAMMLLAAAHQDQKKGHSPLKREVRELASVVQNQEATLQALIRSGRLPRISRWKRQQLPRVPESDSPEGNSPSSADRLHLQPPPQSQQQQLWHQHQLPASPLPHAHGRHPGERALEVHDEASSGTPSLHSADIEEQATLQAAAQLQAAILGRRYERAVSSNSSDRTVEERSAGAISLHSDLDGTPPPTVMNAYQPTRGGPPAGAQPGGGGRDAAGMQEVASRLADMLQAHQMLVTALQQQQHHQQQQPQIPHQYQQLPHHYQQEPVHMVPGSEQRLLEMLQRAAAQRPRSVATNSTPRSASSTGGGRLGRVESTISGSTAEDSARPLRI